MGLLMKQLKKSAREEQVLRALIVVELMTLLNDTPMVTDEEEADLLGDIYTITHGILGHCSHCGDRWMKLVEKYEKFFKENKHGDSERMIKKCTPIVSFKPFIPLYLRG